MIATIWIALTDTNMERVAAMLSGDVAAIRDAIADAEAGNSAVRVTLEGKLLLDDLDAATRSHLIALAHARSISVDTI